jgi:cell fate regulator YaaT (PSP1 superfamily)
MKKMVTVEVYEDEARLKCRVQNEQAIGGPCDCVVDTGNGTQDFCKAVLIENVDEKQIVHEMPVILRRATLQDHAKHDENIVMARIAREKCVAKAAKYNLKMRIIRLRYSFERNILHVVFMADERVDFRDMIKDLSGELKTRIDMKQIGVRDHAGIIGGVASCGRNMCCCSWLSKFDAINVKMARIQKLSLNPSNICGMCGRLKCCLKYENEHYAEMTKLMPRDSEIVETPEGNGMVMERNMLKGLVKVRVAENKVIQYSLSEIKRKNDNVEKSRRVQDEDPGAEWAESEAFRET